jgi:hypothetical protein
LFTIYGGRSAKSFVVGKIGEFGVASMFKVEFCKYNSYCKVYIVDEFGYRIGE